MTTTMSPLPAALPDVWPAGDPGRLVGWFDANPLSPPPGWADQDRLTLVCSYLSETDARGMVDAILLAYPGVTFDGVIVSSLHQVPATGEVLLQVPTTLADLLSWESDSDLSHPWPRTFKTSVDTTSPRSLLTTLLDVLVARAAILADEIDELTAKEVSDALETANGDFADPVTEDYL